MENMEIYEKARSVPAEAVKPITAGRLKGMSDINPMWRIKKLTEIFGPCGFGWWYEITEKRIIDDDATQQRAAFVDILLYCKIGDAVSRGIPGTGGASFVAMEKNGPYLSDECFKMALTDAISVAAKALGVGADVYFAKDSTKYSGSAAPAVPSADNAEEKLSFTCDICKRKIVPYKDRNGRDIGVRKHVNAALTKYGRPICVECIMSGKADEKPA